MVRDRLNSSALDVMYYTSPQFRTEVTSSHCLNEYKEVFFTVFIFQIMNSLTSEVNKLYKLFCHKNPQFKKQSGKVSFVAHSLGIKSSINKILIQTKVFKRIYFKKGTVIVYDILTSNNSNTSISNVYGEDSNQVNKA